MSPVYIGNYAYGHKAQPRRPFPGEPVTCRECGRTLTFVAQTNQPDQWRHPRRQRT